MRQSSPATTARRTHHNHIHAPASTQLSLKLSHNDHPQPVWTTATSTRPLPTSQPKRKTERYLLSVHGRDHLFENLRVDVEEAVDYEGKDGEEKKGAAGKKVEKVRAWQTFRGNEWANRGEKRGESSAKGGEMLAEVRVLGRKEYYQERSGFSPLAFLKNPMILMGVFSLALIVGMPYLMDNMDEETRAEFEEMQKSSPLAQNPAAQLQNFDLASFLAGKTNDQPQQSSQGGGSGSKKRG
ncbi:hypothetical protein BFW01_g4799 [Lasiodiplodia theobromae]|nr:hypothetical protein BFW01_g4799 [Lasiodiplodia theobromae]